MTPAGVISAREGGRFLTTKLGMWRVRGVLGPQLVRRDFLWPVVVAWACLARADERAKEWSQQARHAVAHSNPQICHRNPLLSPAPRPSSIATQYRDLTGPVAEAPDVNLRRTARSLHQAKPGWLRVVVKKPRLVLAEFRATRNIVTAKPRSYCRGCPHHPSTLDE